MRRATPGDTDQRTGGGGTPATPAHRWTVRLGIGLLGIAMLAAGCAAKPEAAEGAGKDSAEKPGDAVAADPELLRVPFDAQAAKAAQQQWAEHLKGEMVETNSVDMKLELIPPGEFTMGSPETELDFMGKHSGNEKQHRVRITRPFYMGVYAVTQEEYEKLMGTNPSDFSAGGRRKAEASVTDTKRFPVEKVSWNNATEFCRKLSQKEGKKYRLPTEAEWEYACRAGTTTPFNFGSSLNGDNANCSAIEPYGTETKGKYVERPTTVGSFKPNAFGLYDMHGNVWQWCQDWLGDDYYANSPKNDPQGPSAGSFRVIRGGSWGSFAVLCRSARRGVGAPRTAPMAASVFV